MKSVTYSALLLLLVTWGISGCDHGAEPVILKCFPDVNDHKAVFVESAAPSFNSDLNNYAKIIFMTKGQVPEICYDTFKLDDLEVLQMNYMGVQYIQDESFTRLKKLRVINLKANNLTRIGPNMFSNLKIKYLMLTSNKIHAIHPDAFDHMPNLEIVSLEDNKISDINPNWFKWSKNVRVLSFENNLISYIPQRAFIHLNSSAERPMKLFLSFNRIESIDYKAFENIQYFDMLDLSRNRLITLPNLLFRSSVLVKQLKLDYNDLLLERDHVSIFRNVHHVSFLGNNMVSCGFVHEFIQQTSWNKTIQTKTQCPQLQNAV